LTIVSLKMEQRFHLLLNKSKDRKSHDTYSTFNLNQSYTPINRHQLMYKVTVRMFSTL